MSPSTTPYLLSLALVALIDQALATGTCHYRDRQGHLLTSLEEVLQSLQTNNLIVGPNGVRKENYERV